MQLSIQDNNDIIIATRSEERREDSGQDSRGKSEREGEGEDRTTKKSSQSVLLAAPCILARISGLTQIIGRLI